MLLQDVAIQFHRFVLVAKAHQAFVELPVIDFGDK
jgi:hypothetical protein